MKIQQHKKIVKWTASRGAKHREVLLKMWHMACRNIKFWCTSFATEMWYKRPHSAWHQIWKTLPPTGPWKTRWASWFLWGLGLWQDLRVTCLKSGTSPINSKAMFPRRHMASTQCQWNVMTPHQHCLRSCAQWVPIFCKSVMKNLLWCQLYQDKTCCNSRRVSCHLFINNQFPPN